MSRNSRNVERVRDVFDGAAQRGLRRKQTLAPRSTAEQEVAAQVEASIIGWCERVDPVSLAALVNAKLAKHMPDVRHLPSPRKSALAAGEAAFAALRFEGDVPSAGGEP